MKKYEYKMLRTTSTMLMKDLNQEGKAGWHVLQFFSEELKEVKTGIFSTAQYSAFQILMEREVEGNG